MFQVSKLNHLKILNLSNNNIGCMEGLKELKLLTWLGLANNKIKVIENLNQNVHLEHLDLSGNFIQTISDLSYLKNLKARPHIITYNMVINALNYRCSCFIATILKR